MEKLRTYLNERSVAEQIAFAIGCGTKLGYFRKALSAKQKFSEGLCMRIEAQSDGQVRCEDLRPDLDWTFLRASQAKPQAA